MLQQRFMIMLVASAFGAGLLVHALVAPSAAASGVPAGLSSASHLQVLPVTRSFTTTADEEDTLLLIVAQQGTSETVDAFFDKMVHSVLMGYVNKRVVDGAAAVTEKYSKGSVTDRAALDAAAAAIVIATPLPTATAAPKATAVATPVK